MQIQSLVAHGAISNFRTSLAAQYGLQLDIGTGVVRWLAEQGYDIDNGVRELTRTVETLFEQPLASLLHERLHSSNRVAVTVSQDALNFEVS